MLSGIVTFAQSAEDLYQKGVQLEEIKGELLKAIEIYSTITKKYSSDKENAAMAQLHIGLCYEKLGKEKMNEALSAFQKVIDLYPSQKNAVLIAKQKLSIETDDTALIEIKDNLILWNKAYESKDIDKYCSFLSSIYFDLKGGIDKVKDNIVNHYFSRWKQISVTSTVKSIVKSGYNYMVDEEASFTNINWDNKIKGPEKTERLIVFTKENERWKILSFQNQLLPAFYKRLNSKYSRVGSANLAYVSHITQTFVSVIDTKTDSLIGIIPSGSGACCTAFSSKNENGYIANFNSNDISVFNKKTNAIVATVPVGEHPSNIEIVNNGRIALITHESNDGLWIMATKNNQIINKMPEITGITLNDTLNNKIYISEIFNPYVLVYNPDNQSILKYIKVGGRPLGIELTPDGKYVYIANFDLNEVEKIDTQLDSVVNRISNVNNARGITISADGKYAYVTNVVSNTVTIIDLENDKIFKTISVGIMPTSACLNKENNCVYVSNQGDGSISVIDTKNNLVVKTIHVADNPNRVQIF